LESNAAANASHADAAVPYVDASGTYALRGSADDLRVACLFSCVDPRLCALWGTHDRWRLSSRLFSHVAHGRPSSTLIGPSGGGPRRSVPLHDACCRGNPSASSWCRSVVGPNRRFCCCRPGRARRVRLGLPPSRASGTCWCSVAPRRWGCRGGAASWRRLWWHVCASKSTGRRAALPTAPARIWDTRTVAISATAAARVSHGQSDAARGAHYTSRHGVRTGPAAHDVAAAVAVAPAAVCAGGGRSVLHARSRKPPRIPIVVVIVSVCGNALESSVGHGGRVCARCPGGRAHRPQRQHCQGAVGSDPVRHLDRQERRGRPRYVHALHACA
jgi:hypothetical protein